MQKIIGFKEQANGLKSWIIQEVDSNDNEITKTMTTDKSVVFNYLLSIPESELNALPFIDSINRIELEKHRYDKRVTDGQSAYLMLMAELRLNSITNNLPREVNREIEEKLESVRIQVVSGQWISALEKLQAVQVGGYLTQQLYDRIQTSLTEYIAANY